MGEQRGKLIFIVILAICIVAGSFYSFWQKTSVSENVSSGEVLAKGTTEKAEKTTELVVYISGAVYKPGVYTLPNYARVNELVTMAGGLAVDADATKINMAQLLKDGMHIHVMPMSAVLNVGNEMAYSNKERVNIAGNTGQKVNINTADKREFDALPGVGPALAERIVEYRQTNGGFSTLEGLKKVPGIGASKFEKLKDKITL